MAAKSKVIAFYLPQFHRILENDKWWGDGFTEWTNVRRAVALFDKHDQPRVPLGKNYYNLLDPTVILEQCEQATQFGVYGFSFYHYWFDGKLLLEKPVELFLETPDANIKFCLTWANEPWSRTWEGNSKELLMEQAYGNDESIRQHFKYLLKFFNDPRYIVQHGKPMLLLYRAESVTNFERYVELFNELAVENGFKGINWVLGNTVFNKSATKDHRLSSFSRYDLQPQEALARRPFVQKVFQSLNSRTIGIVNDWFGLTIPVRLYDYDVIWRSILSRNSDPKSYYGAFVDWDNSPRRGPNGTIFRGFTIKKFSKFFSKAYARSCTEDKEFIFVNAWNEWAEGAYLEQDETYGKSKLEVVKSIVGVADV